MAVIADIDSMLAYRGFHFLFDLNLFSKRQVSIAHRRRVISRRTESLAPPSRKIQIFTQNCCRISVLFNQFKITERLGLNED
jgi:hypothetical protein